MHVCARLCFKANFHTQFILMAHFIYFIYMSFIDFACAWVCFNCNWSARKTQKHFSLKNWIKLQFTISILVFFRILFCFIINLHGLHWIFSPMRIESIFKQLNLFWNFWIFKYAFIFPPFFYIECNLTMTICIWNESTIFHSLLEM